MDSPSPSPYPCHTLVWILCALTAAFVFIVSWPARHLCAWHTSLNSVCMTCDHCIILSIRPEEATILSARFLLCALGTSASIFIVCTAMTCNLEFIVCTACNLCIYYVHDLTHWYILCEWPDTFVFIARLLYLSCASTATFVFIMYYMQPLYVLCAWPANIPWSFFSVQCMAFNVAIPLFHAGHQQKAKSVTAMLLCWQIERSFYILIPRFCYTRALVWHILLCIIHCSTPLFCTGHCCHLPISVVSPAPWMTAKWERYIELSSDPIVT